MNVLEKALAAVAPQYALRRAMAARQLSRLYEAADYSHHYPQRASAAAPDVSMQRAGGRLRDQARYYEENDAQAVAIFDDLVNYVAGADGPNIEPMTFYLLFVELVDLNRELATLWDEFWDAPDITGELSGSMVNQLSVRSWLRDGDVFTQLVTDPAAPHRNDLGLSLELLEGDLVPFDSITGRAGVVHGVEKNDWGQPTAFYVYKHHPADFVRGTLGVMPAELKRVPADRMIHLKFVRRLGQTRGVPVVHAVLRTLGDIKEAWESERLAMRIAAMMVVAIRRELGTAGLPEALTDDASKRVFEFDAGMVWPDLLPGEGPEVIKSDRTKALQRFVAGGTGTRYSSTARDYNGTYSAQRQELVEAVIGYRRLFAHYRDRQLKRIRRTLIQQAIARRRLTLPPALDDATLYRAEYRPPVLPWISPKEEVEAYGLAIQHRLIAPQQAIRDLGRNPAEVRTLLEQWGIDPDRPEDKQDGGSDKSPIRAA